MNWRMDGMLLAAARSAKRSRKTRAVLSLEERLPKITRAPAWMLRQRPISNPGYLFSSVTQRKPTVAVLASGRSYQRDVVVTHSLSRKQPPRITFDGDLPG